MVYRLYRQLKYDNHYAATPATKLQPTTPGKKKESPV